MRKKVRLLTQPGINSFYTKILAFVIAYPRKKQIKQIRQTRPRSNAVGIHPLSPTLSRRPIARSIRGIIAKQIIKGDS